MGMYDYNSDYNGKGLPKELQDYFLQFGDPRAGFFSFLNNQNLGGTTPKSDYAQGQYSRLYSNYLSQAAEHPGRGFVDYLKTQNPLEGFASLSPERRGFSTAISSPRVRWNL